MARSQFDPQFVNGVRRDQGSRKWYKIEILTTHSYLAILHRFGAMHISYRWMDIVLLIVAIGETLPSRVSTENGERT